MTQDNSTNQKKIVVHVDTEIEDLVPGFLENRHNDVKTLQEALTKGDYETIRILGHSMKGSGGGYGFDAISEIGRSLEDAAKAKNTEETRRLIDELLHYLERVEVIYE